MLEWKDKVAESGKENAQLYYRYLKTELKYLSKYASCKSITT